MWIRTLPQVPIRPAVERVWSGIAIYLVSAVVTLIAAETAAGASSDIRTPILIVGAGVVVPILLHVAATRRLAFARVFQLITLILMVTALVGTWRELIPQRPYGDGDGFASFIAAGRTFPRWQLGSAAALALYTGIWQFPGVAVHMNSATAAPGMFLGLLCTTVIGISTIAILQRWPDRLCVIFPVLTPVWTLFSSGYVEYYPLIVGPWVAALAWTFEGPIEDRRLWHLALIIGLMPVLYVGFVGLSALLFAAVVVRRPARALPLLGATATVFVLTVVATGTDLPTYLRTLYSTMNFGERFNSYPRYGGQSAGEASVFFRTAYVFTREHFADVAYAMFWGAGWAFLPLMLLAAASAAASKDVPKRLGEPRLWIGGLLVAWQLYYLMYMIPKMGPTKDIDLFFTTYATVAFVAGMLLDIDRGRAGRVAYPMLCVLTGVSIATASHLVWTMLPPRG